MVELIYLMISVMVGFIFLNKFILMFFCQNLIFIMMFMFMFFNMNVSGLFNWVNSYGDYSLDNISFFLILLIFWVISLMYLSSMNMFYMNYYIMVSGVMLLSLLLLFLSLNMMSFYLFFEVSLIPIILMILGWGGQPERLMAVLYLIIYTLFFSLPFLFMLMNLWNDNSSINFFIMFLYKFYLSYNFYFYLMMLMIFLVKLPVYFIHLWLPKAHVEAPIFGSMVLAGVLLKMGGYGVFRVFYILMNLCMKFNLFLIIFSFIGAIIISLICLLQIDLKMLIAYSSVVHMSLMLCGSGYYYCWGLMGMIMMMIGHGLCSSGLFCLLNFSYKRINSRSVIFNSGLINYFPNMSLFWFSFSVMNMAAPPSLNLVSEVMLILSVVKINLNLLILLFLVSLFSSIYSIYIYSITQHGVPMVMNNYWVNSVDEYLLMFFHFIPMNFMIWNIYLFF